MSRFIVIKKRTIIIFVIALLLFIFSSAMLFKFIKSENYIPTYLSNEDIEKGISIDLNGDGKKDLLYLDTSKEDYSVIAKIQSKEFSLLPKDKNFTLGRQSNKDRIYINILDLSRDDIPEIIVSTYIDKHPVSHVFKYIDSNFLNILSTEQNILGVLNSNNTRTPSLFSVSSSKGDESAKSFIIKKDNFKDTSFNKAKIPGLSSIQLFIDSIEKQYEVLETPDIFTIDIDSNELSLLWNLNKEIYNYSFENGFFKDISWDEHGEINKLECNLHFNVSKKSSNESPSVITIRIKLNKCEDNSYKISSISKK